MLTDLDYDLLSAYIDDALTAEERASLESRLQSEPELRSELEELRATVTLLNNLPPRKAPRDFTLDARYARRTSFFASATFSALSTAAAIILFAVGAFLFTNNNQPPTSSNQSAQVALGSTAVTATSATTLDKGLIATATDDAVANEVAPVTAPTILEQESTEETLADGIVQQATLTVLPSTENEQESESSLFNPDVEAPTDGQDNGDTFNAAPASPVESQERSTEATATVTGQTFGMQPQPTIGAMGGAAPSAPPASDTGDAMSSMMMVATESPTPAEVMGFATTMLPAATLAPSSTQLPTLPPTATIAPTATATPTLTLTNTPAPTATSTHTSTPEPTPVPPVERERTDTTNLLPLAVLVLASVFLVLGVATTIARRRSR